ncbi:voltage-dependent calcium channel subunit alpha-2/delta-2-like [Gigantopelta aegis]|uniref:voltage-dependent calcium channel subunit alpha-2/delta-2-like n=1 Tax=Gigantopelta aegis TaxID=1735272 RepID=UPI001B887C1F|nr:voltage-dependent calcium channel subunit alpha-2/delta-2-like [Gigantopelta aegis]
MATARCGVLVLSLCVCFLLNCCTVSDGAKSLPDFTSVRTWARRLDLKWKQWISILTGYDTVQLRYQAASNLSASQSLDVQVTFEKVVGAELVRGMSADLSIMFNKKMKLLKNTVEVAETAAASHVWNGSLEKKDVHFYNTKEMQDVVLEYDERFQQKINDSFSSVHIPVEIYEGDAEILNGLKWTADLDTAFKDNYDEDEEILWQYFGSKTGFMRTFPASSWKMHGKVDMYDVRRQSWYTQGSSSPKDMMILIDKSGSTHGQALQLMKVTVKSILDTLGENDFVNIVAFSQEAEFVSTCFNHTPFVQANHRNKQRLSRDVDMLKASGMANYKVGLKFVFEQFEKFSNSTDPLAGSGCNKVIMLLTDGGTDNAEEIFKHYNWPNKTVRVFTYAIGPTANPTTAIRWMACANRGFFSQIPAMGAIRAKVQDYIPVLSRPQVLLDLKHFQWGDLYYDHLGLGMMTSVTLPVYNRTIGSSNQTILGVMGIDVTTEAMRRRTPTQQVTQILHSYNENQYLDVGKFLGKVDPPVMETLFNKSLYIRNKQFDFQGVCYKNDSEVSAGPSSLRIPSVNLLFDALSLNWWTSKLAWAYLNFNLFNWFTTSTAELTIPTDENLYHCNKFMYQYYYGDTQEVNEPIICDNCTRTIMAVKIIENTNLLLVVTDPMCDECTNMYPPLPQEPMEVTEEEEEEVICEMAKYPEFRRQSKECYNYDPREDDTKCGCSSLLSVSKSQLLVLYATMCTLVLLMSDR